METEAPKMNGKSNCRKKERTIEEKTEEKFEIRIIQQSAEAVECFDVIIIIIITTAYYLYLYYVSSSSSSSSSLSLIFTID